MCKNKKFLLITNLVFLVALIIGDIFYITMGGIVTKTLTSMLFVMLGAINLTYVLMFGARRKSFAILMCIGLVFACLGDIFLEIQFITGAALFAGGHILFFLAYCTIYPIKWRDFLFGAVIFVPSLLIILLVPLFNFGGILMQIVCCVYALIISLMVGKAISNLISKTCALNIILLIGSVFFFFSDFFLLFSVFANVSNVFGILCLSLYYPAEFFLAFAISKSRKENVENK